MQRAKDDADRSLVQAWWIVNLAATTWSTGRVPDLQGLLTTRPATRPQSLAEQRAVLEQLSQRLGQPLRTNADRKRLQMTDSPRKAAS